MPEQTGATELKPNVHHSRQRRTEDLIKPPAPLLEPSASALFSSPISVFREKRQSENQPRRLQIRVDTNVFLAHLANVRVLLRDKDAIIRLIIQLCAESG